MAKNPSQKRKVPGRSSWSPEEDAKLIAYISKYGIWNWNEMPKYAGLSRSGKSCRLRWMNYLRPGIKRGNITREEEEMIIDLHKIMGNRWAAIAAKIPQRTDNEIKNYWHTKIKKRYKVNDFPISENEFPEDHKYVADDDHEVQEENYNNVSDTGSSSSSSLSSTIEESLPQYSTTYDIPLAAQGDFLAKLDCFGSSETCNEVQSMAVLESSVLNHELCDFYYVPSYELWDFSFI